MSYLVLPGGIPDFTKAVISLWFRVPQASIEKVVAASPPGGYFPPPNLADMSILPLLTFGRQQKQVFYSAAEVNVASYHGPGAENYGPIYDTPDPVEHDAKPVVPSFAGLSCYLDRVSGRNIATLTFNLQTAVIPGISGTLYNKRSVEVWTGDVPGFDANPGSGWTSQAGGFALYTTLVDNSFTEASQPGCFNIPTPIAVAPDHWHHLLLSFDISNGCVTSGSGGDVASGVSSFSKLWCALDDVNYDGANLGGYGSGDPNMILTVLGLHVSGVIRSIDGSNCFNGPGNYSLASATIPAAGAHLGIPSSVAYVDDVYNVEMAEFQMWTGIAFDTGVESNRRAFVDQDGKPVPPTKKASDTDRQSGSIELLGKPAVLLHRSGNWKSGRNTGFLGIDNNGNTILSGQFAPTGVIKTYKPDPSLRGPQSPPPGKAGPVRLSRKPVPAK